MKKDFITQKLNRLKSLTDESLRALSIVTDSITNLENVNVEISNTIDEIQNAEDDLAGIKKGLVARRDTNQKIAEKFRSLIEE